jgi:hypothetical protein
MTTLLRVILFFFIISEVNFQVLAAERGLLEPDWNDPVVARARNNLQLAPRSIAPPTSANKEGEAPLSLPRWGFGQKIDSHTPEERPLARAVQPTAAVPAWPNCASKTPKTGHVRDKSGVWYSDDYDFGCVIITVSGDRAFSPDLKFPSGIAATDDCGQQARAAPPPTDDSESDNRGRFELQISLNRLPYTIVGRCLEGAEAFCRNRAAQCTLVGRLIFLGGSPQ